MKKCPFCAEDILSEAIKCKHCGSMLDGSASSTPTGQPPGKEVGAKAGMHPMTFVPLIFGGLLAVLICSGASQSHFGDSQRQMAMMVAIGAAVISAVIYASGRRK